jgi:hypothetical protein
MVQSALPELDIVRLFPPEPWLVGATKIYLGAGDMDSVPFATEISCRHIPLADVRMRPFLHKRQVSMTRSSSH